MNASNHTGVLSTGASTDAALSLFADVEHIVIALSGLALGVVVTCFCFLCARRLQNRRNRTTEELL